MWRGMIYGVTGLLGGGKTLGAVVDMADHLRRGCIVVTNIQLNLAEIAKDLDVDEAWLRERYRYIDVEEDIDPYAWPMGDRRGTPNQRKVLIVIDEAGEWFSNLEGNKQLKAFTSFLRHSDKRGQDVYLIVQDPSILFRQGRVLVHRWLYMRNMRHWKIPGLGWGLPPPWRYEFHRLLHDSTGKTLLSRTCRLLGTRPYTYYDTSATYGDSARAESASVDGYGALTARVRKTGERDWIIWPAVLGGGLRCGLVALSGWLK
jgi:hypothetical protein